MTKWQWIWGRLRAKLWVRAALFCLLGVVSASVSFLVEDWLPPGIGYEIGAESIDGILNILASSMLATTTFSLSVMVAAYATAADTATPRATKLLYSDHTAQNALSTFIGTFLFSLVGIIALKTDSYSDNGRLVLFLVTVVLIAFIVFTLVRWINYLSMLGRLGQTITTVEDTAKEAVARYRNLPLLGAQEWVEETPPKSYSHGVYDVRVGYVQYIDMAKLEALAEHLDTSFYIEMRPGVFNDLAKPLLYLSCACSEDIQHKIRKCFIIADDRSFEQDPRFGIMVLTEIASKALGPATNDLGTAIDILNVHVRVFTHLFPDGSLEAEEEGRRQQEEKRCVPQYKHLYLKDIPLEDFFKDAFLPIIRDGSGSFDINLRLLKLMAALSMMGDGRFYPYARDVAHYAMRMIAEKPFMPEERQALKKIADSLEEQPKHRVKVYHNITSKRAQHGV